MNASRWTRLTKQAGRSRCGLMCRGNGICCGYFYFERSLRASAARWSLPLSRVKSGFLYGKTSPPLPPLTTSGPRCGSPWPIWTHSRGSKLTRATCRDRLRRWSRPLHMYDLYWFIFAALSAMPAHMQHLLKVSRLVKAGHGYRRIDPSTRPSSSLGDARRARNSCQ